MTAPISPVQEDLFTTLRSFILGLISCPVIQGLGNGVPTPLGGFICMTEISRTRLSTNIETYVDPVTDIGTKASRQSQKVIVQIDCYGPDSAEWASILSTMMRDEYAYDALQPVLSPLSADDPVMMPFVDGEQQYQQRWMVKAEFQFCPTVITPMAFFEEVEIKKVLVP